MLSKDASIVVGQLEDSNIVWSNLDSKKEVSLESLAEDTVLAITGGAFAKMLNDGSIHPLVH